MKIQIKSASLSPFAGISFFEKCFNTSGLQQLIDNELGSRVATIGYSYSDIIKNYWAIFFAGGDCAEDIQANLGKHLKSMPGNAVPSADTLLRGLKELATQNTKYTSASKILYDFNINRNLNGLNIKSLLLTGQLESGQQYDLDYDNQIIAAEKYDTKRTYKKNTGYFPGIATIGNKVVYIENRDGNANVKFEQAATLTRMYKLLQDNKVAVNRSRMDAGSYAKEIIDVVAANSKLFYIRSNKSAEMYGQISRVTEWETVEINYIKYEVASIPFAQFYQDRNYRQVIMREKSGTQQADLFTGDN